MRPFTDLRLIFGSVLIVVGLSAAPAAPRHHSANNTDDRWRHSVNISGSHHQPANDCSDLHFRFDDRDAMVRSETRTLSKEEAAVLKVHPHANGGTQVVGWDNPNYSVTVCKAVEAGNDAERVLSQIGMTIENGSVSTHGPSGEEYDWTVYLLIRAPKSAAMELETTNGPISLYDVDGKLTAHANNGPISLHNFSGDADVTAQNGPISMDGSSGKIRIKTQNGPISVDLKETSWNGELTADAQNGPVTLRVPSGFQSSFIVESTNHAPMSCHASICGSARKTWDDEHRRIEFGSSPAVVHLSTVNGPVSVEDGRD